MLTIHSRNLSKRKRHLTPSKTFLFKRPKDWDPLPECWAGYVGEGTTRSEPRVLIYALWQQPPTMLRGYDVTPKLRNATIRASQDKKPVDLQRRMGKGERTS
jgi:hypothetical protein